MSEISQSHGTIDSVLGDSSTPSNNSEYFSVTSSLDILNCNDEEFYSLDEDNNAELQCNTIKHFRKYECNKIVIDSDDTIHNRISNSNEELPSMGFNVGHVDVEDWDTVCDNLHSVISRESVSTEEEEDANNYSVLTDEISNRFLTEKLDLHNDEEEENDHKEEIDENEDNEENASSSVNNMTQMSNSVIEGELSDINDIVYESSISQEPCLNDSDNDNGFKEEEEDEEESLVDDKFCILEMANKIVSKVVNPEFDGDYEEIKETDTSEKYFIQEQESNVTTEPEERAIELLIDPSETDVISDIHKYKAIETIEDSPVKTSALCCSIKRKKIKSNSQTSKKRTTKSTSLFSFLMFFKRDRGQLIIGKSVSEVNIYKHNENVCFISMDSDRYSGIPFIDEETSNDSGSYIPLAKHEMYCD